MSNQIIQEKKKFNSLKNYLIKKGSNFDIISSGTTEKIIYKDSSYQYVNIKDVIGKGHHLSRMVKSDIEIWLEENPGKLQSHPHRYKEQLFNLSAIENHLNFPCAAIDISDCYWRTIYHLGYITQKTFLSGMRNKEWKRGRNASIGGLAKNERKYIYKKGKIINRSSSFVQSKKEYRYIRNHVINTVYDIFWELHEEIGNDFLMFLTDCVFTDSSRTDFVEKFFRKYGYRFKTKSVEFTKVDRENKIIHWYDFESKPKEDPKTGELRDTRDKFYFYANNQVIDGVLYPPITPPNKKIEIRPY